MPKAMISICTIGRKREENNHRLEYCLNIRNAVIPTKSEHRLRTRQKGPRIDMNAKRGGVCGLRRGAARRGHSDGRCRKS